MGTKSIWVGRASRLLGLQDGDVYRDTDALGAVARGGSLRKPARRIFLMSKFLRQWLLVKMCTPCNKIP